jgi:hypothetical protein
VDAFDPSTQINAYPDPKPCIGLRRTVEQSNDLLIVSDLYSEKLINEGTVTKEEVVAVIDKYEKICEDAYKKAAEETQTFHKHWLDSPWSGFFEGKDPLHVSDTGKALPSLFLRS